MTEERRLKLESLLDDAVSSGDDSKIEAIRRTIDRETLECTAHTSARIKLIETRTEKIEKTVDKIAEALHVQKAVTNALSESGGDWKKVALALLKYGGWLVAILAALLKVNLPS